MTFKELLNKNFKKRQKKISCLYTLNKKSIEILDISSGITSLLFFFSFIFLIEVFLKSSLLSGIVFSLLTIFVFIFLLKTILKNTKKTQNLTKKIKKNKYQDIIYGNQYNLLIKKIKKCNFEELKDNKKLIFDYIKKIDIEKQEEILTLINNKIKLYENGISNVEKKIDFLIDKTNNIQNNNNNNLKIKSRLKSI